MLQNRGLRCALGKDTDTSTDELHNDVGLLKLHYRRDQHLLNFMYDLSRDDGNLKAQRTEGVKTRSSHKKLMRVKKPRTERFKRSLAYKGSKKWNALTKDMQFTETKGEFKTNVALLRKLSPYSKRGRSMLL